MNHSTPIIFSLTLLIVSIFSGCGGGSDTEKTPGTSSPIESSKEPEQPSYPESISLPSKDGDIIVTGDCLAGEYNLDQTDTYAILNEIFANEYSSCEVEFPKDTTPATLTFIDVVNTEISTIITIDINESVYVSLEGSCIDQSTDFDLGQSEKGHELILYGLPKGRYEGCTIIGKDFADHISTMTVPAFSVDVDPDLTPPVINELTSIGYTKSTSVDYTFIISEDSHATYWSRQCDGNRYELPAGQHTVKFEALSFGRHDCTFHVKDKSKNETAFDLSPFMVLPPGITVTDISQLNNLATRITEQPDGKLLVVGTTTSDENSDLFIIRYLESGQIDRSFGVNGVVIYDSGDHDIGMDIKVLPDGKLLVTGSSEKDRQKDILILRLETDGSLDKNFSSLGVKYLDFEGGDDLGYFIELLSDNSIIIVGTAFFIGSYDDLALIKLTPEGNLDSDFGYYGRLRIPLSQQVYPSDIAVTKNDKMLISISGSKSMLVKFNVDGTLDTSFGDQGKLAASVNDIDFTINSMTILQNGEILSTGYTYDSFNRYTDFIVTKYQPNGTLVKNFGAYNGFSLIDFTQLMENNTESTDRLYSMALQNDGKIILTGQAIDFFNNRYFALARLTTDGKLDSTFGESGGVIIEDKGFDSQKITDLTVLSDHSIVTLGRAEGIYGSEVILMKYTETGVLDTENFGLSVDKLTIEPSQ